MHSFQIQVQDNQKDLLLEALNEIREKRLIKFEVVEIPTTQSRRDEESDKRNSGGGECSSDQPGNAVIVEESRDLEQESDLETPKEISESLSKWLQCNSVARSEFAKHIGRSKSHLSDLLKRPPPSLPNGSGKVVWIKMKEFITNSAAKELFLDSQKKKPTLKRKRAAMATDKTSTPTTLTVKKDPTPTPAKLKSWQRALLDEMFVRCSGRPDTETVREICSTLLLNKRQVNVRLLALLIFLYNPLKFVDRDISVRKSR